MCQRSEELMDLSMDPNGDSGKHHNIVLQTNDVTIEPTTDIEANNSSSETTNGKHNPAPALSPSSIILSSPCSDNNENPSNNISNNNNNNNGINDTADDEYDEVKRFFDKKLHIIEKWLRDRASPEIQSKLYEAVNDIAPKSPKALRTPSVTSDLFQQWLSTSPIQKRSSSSRVSLTSRQYLANLDEGELFMELIRDISNELDINVLCHKILVNVCLLTHADRGSLFLAKGTNKNRYLVAKLFDVNQDTVLDEATVGKASGEEIVIPFGVGIAGTVAQTKTIVNIKNAYEDPRFNCEIDQKTGYRTKNILSMPICNYEGDVIGVAQIINKTKAPGEFTEHDVEVFRRYLTFCGIGIQNAQLFEMSVQEYRRNQILLNLARSIFEEQNNLECLVTKILTEARELLKCKRSTVFLLDLDCCESSHIEKIIEKPQTSGLHQPLSRRQSHNVNVEDIIAQQNSRARFTLIFDIAQDSHTPTIARPTINDLNTSSLAQIAQVVAATSQLFNIIDIIQWAREHPEIPVDDELKETQAVLCMPIINAQKSVIGVVQFINKENGTLFTDSDVSIIEAFAIFCGLGIHNTQMYENACKLMAKQKVALECLSYHATAAPSQTTKLVQDIIQSAEDYCLYSFKFIDFDLDDEDTCRAAVRMFLQCNLVQQFHIPYDVLCRWILSVKKNYRPVKYHNWRHALNVTQTMFAMMKTGKMERFVTDLEILGLLVACLCHDLDHRGTNNSFQTKTTSPLAILYTTSTMEHHHFDQCIMILSSEGNNIFQALSPDDYRRVMKIVEEAILSTDLAMYFDKYKKFAYCVENGEFDWQTEDKKELLCGMMMTACDVSAIAKPWEVQHRVAKLVADEFFDQGDLEKLQLNTKPIAMMDRERKDELPQMQVSFIDMICLPLYKMLSDTFPWIKPLYQGTLNNRNHWQDLAEKVEMGLTWIDHDTIDKPVEEFGACADEVKGIEFSITTLNCAQDQNNVVPEQRRKFSSLRKTGALSKAVRSKISKSFYSNSNSSKQDKSTTGNVQVSDCEKISDIQFSGKEKTTVCTEATTTMEKLPTNKTNEKFEKHKKRSKLCQLL
ncbi:cGMP-specific 3',5'-cyclic phosphodiesterase [Contarinia nasturtii]|uniref:cGMP-specific 3',5'-cyclic phosphodiesterase n=1 Tax=Contarinia nasturtii TaxID=265458 RepID=UPI0012D3D6BF|nr:cGMP-specific 3',5'-cyclic phosphodiesterase [Contarinia nasturtii]XP_031641165.1 cGMP-specific 3',5'-cyclic phosphodiesterase [Contarinia nasturtii]XP_031641166.1 cGMP-specific 3',5'-cyclic phosphodiesterase [Contarinia nasturtii]